MDIVHVLVVTLAGCQLDKLLHLRKAPERVGSTCCFYWSVCSRSDANCSLFPTRFFVNRRRYLPSHQHSGGVPVRTTRQDSTAFGCGTCIPL